MESLLGKLIAAGIGLGLVAAEVGIFWLGSLLKSLLGL
jgi:hypothetical protein